MFNHGVSESEPSGLQTPRSIMFERRRRQQLERELRIHNNLYQSESLPATPSGP